MTIQKINYGLAPDDGTGDPLRQAFKKTDDNFVDLDARKAEQQDVVDALATKVDKVTGKGLSTEDFTTAEKQKLDGVEDGATANSTDAYLLDRANHTGTQSAATLTDVVGPISSGAIIERGSNANGEYTKFADGTLICLCNKYYASITPNTSIAGWEYGLDVYTDFPSEFISIPTVIGYAITEANILLLAGHPSTSRFVAYAYVLAKNYFDACYVSFIAIGRWE